MGLLYIIYQRNVSRRFVKGIYKGSICIVWGINESYIRSRPKVYGNILGSFYSKTKNPNSDFNGILFIDKWINKKTEPDIKIIFMSLY